MLRSKLPAALRAGAVGLTLLPMAATADTSRASVLASTCFACHGPEGKSESTMPSLYGYPPEIMVVQMAAFGNGARPATMMDRHALGYTDDEIEMIAHYLGQLSQ